MIRSDRLIRLVAEVRLVFCCAEKKPIPLAVSKISIRQRPYLMPMRISLIPLWERKKEVRIPNISTAPKAQKTFRHCWKYAFRCLVLSKKIMSVSKIHAPSLSIAKVDWSIRPIP